jgi:hypothetical protein
MHEIDVHILHLPDSRRDWLANAIGSLTGERVNLYVVPGHRGDIGAGRRDGFAQGTAPYVSFVDADDWIVPRIFDEIIPLLKPDTIIYTDEILYVEKSKRFWNGWSIDPAPFKNDPRLELCKVPGTTDKYMHHLVVIPRHFLEGAPYEKGFAPEPAILRHAYNKGAKFQRLPRVGYNWRIHSAQSTWKT